MASILTPFREKFTSMQLDRRRGFLDSTWTKLNE